MLKETFSSFKKTNYPQGTYPPAGEFALWVELPQGKIPAGQNKQITRRKVPTGNLLSSFATIGSFMCYNVVKEKYYPRRGK